jgi:hypothetical protein
LTMSHLLYLCVRFVAPQYCGKTFGLHSVYVFVNHAFVPMDPAAKPMG